MERERGEIREGGGVCCGVWCAHPREWRLLNHAKDARGRGEDDEGNRTEQCPRLWKALVQAADPRDVVEDAINWERRGKGGNRVVSILFEGEERGGGGASFEVERSVPA